MNDLERTKLTRISKIFRRKHNKKLSIPISTLTDKFSKRAFKQCMHMKMKATKSRPLFSDYWSWWQLDKSVISVFKGHVCQVSAELPDLSAVFFSLALFPYVSSVNFTELWHIFLALTDYFSVHSLLCKKISV